MNLVPAEDKIIVLPDPVKDMTEGGIALPEVAKEKQTAGLIQFTHPNSKYKPGQHIFYPHYAGTEITINNIKHHLVLEKEIWYVEEV